MQSVQLRTRCRGCRGYVAHRVERTDVATCLVCSECHHRTVLPAAVQRWIERRAAHRLH